MSIGAGLDLDLAALVGEMPAAPCESPHHCEHVDSRHGGAGVFYARSTHECMGPVGALYVICEPYAAYHARLNARRDPMEWTMCQWCGRVLRDIDLRVEVIAPVSGRS